MTQAQAQSQAVLAFVQCSNAVQLLVGHMWGRRR